MYILNKKIRNNAKVDCTLEMCTIWGIQFRIRLGCICFSMWSAVRCVGNCCDHSKRCLLQIFEVIISTSQDIPRLVSHGFRKFILLPTSNVSELSYWQKRQRSGFDLYMDQKPKIHQIWLKMVSNYLSQNKLPKQNIYDKIIQKVLLLEFVQGYIGHMS